jgi:hypothetical protein
MAITQGGLRMATLKNRKGRHTLLITALLLTLFLTGYSVCRADVEDLQVTKIAIQDNSMIITVYNPTSNSETAIYRASAILVDLSEETSYSNSFTIGAGQTMQISVDFSDLVLCGGTNGPDPIPTI